MYASKPIIGIVGGIGSGKSFVADLFGELGCLVIHSDEQVRDAYRREDVKQRLREWWGKSVFLPDGSVDRKAISKRVFSDAAERHRLEELLFPIVGEEREKLMQAGAKDRKVPAFVWDAPLLIEAGLSKGCDTIVFVQSPPEQRQARVRATRNWAPDELTRRENLQLPLDNKRAVSDYVVDNTADADYARGQVRDVLSRIRARWTPPQA